MNVKNVIAGALSSSRTTPDDDDLDLFDNFRRLKITIIVKQQDVDSVYI